MTTNLIGYPPKIIASIPYPRDPRFHQLAVFENPGFTEMHLSVPAEVTKQQKLADIGACLSVVFLVGWIVGYISYDIYFILFYFHHICRFGYYCVDLSNHSHAFFRIGAFLLGTGIYVPA